MITTTVSWSRRDQNKPCEGRHVGGLCTERGIELILFLLSIRPILQLSCLWAVHVTTSRYLTHIP